MNAKCLLNIIKGCAFLALLTPFIVNTDYYFPYTGPKGVYFMALAEIAFFAWVILALKFKQYRPDFKNPVVFSVIMFLATIFAGAVFGANFSNSFWSTFERMGGVLMFCHLTAFFIVVASIFKKHDWINFFSASVIIAGVVAVEALFNQTSAARGGGFFGNDSFWGAYILFNLFISLYLFLKSGQSKKKRFFYGIAFLSLLFCLLVEGTQFWRSVIGNESVATKNFLINVFNSGARAAKISFFAGMSLLGVLWLATRRKSIIKAVGLLFLAVGFFGVIGAIFLIADQKNEFYQKIEKQFKKGTVHGRIVVWETAWKGFLERPLLGWGPENFDLAFARHYNPCMGSAGCAGEIWFDRAHNVVFDFLVEAGVLGLLAYLGMFVAAIFVLWRGYFQNKFGFAEAGVFTSLLAAYFLQNLTVFDMTASYLMFFSCLGFAAFCDNPKKENNSDLAKSIYFKKFPVIAIIVVAAICFFNFVLGPLAADRNVILAAKSPFGSEQRLDYYKKTFAASPMGKYQIRLFFARMWLEKLEDKDAIAKMDKEQIIAEFEFIADQLEKSVDDSPLDFKSRLKLGELYNAWSLFDRSKIVDAEIALRKAMRLAPDNQLSYWHLAQNMLYQSRVDEAMELAQAAYDLYPQNAQAKRVLEEIQTIRDNHQ